VLGKRGPSGNQKRQPGFRVRSATQVRRLVGYDNLERRPDMTFQKMTSERMSVASRHDHMGMQAGLTVLYREIADESEYFDLIVDLDRLVILLVDIEKSQLHVPKGAKRSEACRCHVMGASEGKKVFDRFFAGLQNDGEASLSVGFQFLDLHAQDPFLQLVPVASWLVRFANVQR